jgi:hypothetical protein
MEATRYHARRTVVNKMSRYIIRACIALAMLSAVAAGIFYIKARERDRLLDAFLVTALAGVDRSDRDAVAIAVSRAVYARTNRGIPADSLAWYERHEATSFFNVSAGVALKYGTYGVIGHRQFGRCGTMARLLLVALWRLRVPARKLQLLGDFGNGHTMVEYRVGDRWHVISPGDSSFVWRTASGGVATVEEIRADSAIYGQIFARYPTYEYDFRHPSHIRWEKLPAPVRGAFHRVLGDRAYTNATTPRVYETPRRLLLVASLVALVFWVLLAASIRRAAHRRAAH